LREAIAACCFLGAIVALAGCESTIDQARKITARGEHAFTQREVSISKTDRRIRVLGSAIVQDASGTAVVVELRSSAPKPIAQAPILIDVHSRRGKLVFTNDAPGAETDLAHVPLLVPGRVFDWVDDQVLPSGTPAGVLARVGTGKPAAGPLPSIRVSAVHLTNDPANGYAASGQVLNASRITQLHLVLFAIARRGTRIVAAGRAILTRLAAGKTATFHAYFIGNPSGATLSVSAPPSVLAR
jgi:hypothetical protein